MNVSLVDFGVYEGTSGGTGTGSSGGGGYCPRHLYAELRDDVTGRTTRVCGGEREKEREREREREGGREGGRERDNRRREREEGEIESERESLCE